MREAQDLLAELKTQHSELMIEAKAFEEKPDEEIRAQIEKEIREEEEVKKKYEELIATHENEMQS